MCNKSVSLDAIKWLDYERQYHPQVSSDGESLTDLTMYINRKYLMYTKRYPLLNYPIINAADAYISRHVVYSVKHRMDAMNADMEPVVTTTKLTWLYAQLLLQTRRVV